MKWFDTHVHLDDEQYSHGHDPVIQRALAAGVGRLLAVATSAKSSAACVAMAQQYPGVYAAVGIHPNYCGAAPPEDWDQVLRLVSQPKVVALGETGLDRYWDQTPWEQQQDYFERHLLLGQKMQLPTVIHQRDCAAELMAMLRVARQRAPLRGILHSFSGDAAMARDAVEMGLHISFSGMLTFKKSEMLREVASTIPADRLLLETDAPYLSPHPHRGTRPNEPALLVHTAACLAEVRGVSLEKLCEQTTRNACDLFGIQIQREC